MKVINAMEYFGLGAKVTNEVMARYEVMPRYHRPIYLPEVNDLLAFETSAIQELERRASYIR